MRFHAIYEPAPRPIVLRVAKGWGMSHSAVAIGGIAATLLLALIALFTLWLTDYRQRQNTSPVVDVDNVQITEVSRDEIGDYVKIEFTILNAGGGPALDIRLTLKHYGNEICTTDPIAYIAPLAPGATRLSPHAFHLPPRQPQYKDNEPWALSITWNGTFATGGEAFVESPGQTRERVTLASVPLFQLRNLRSRRRCPICTHDWKRHPWFPWSFPGGTTTTAVCDVPGCLCTEFRFGRPGR
jgi:hypothetical protein